MIDMVYNVPEPQVMLPQISLPESFTIPNEYYDRYMWPEDSDSDHAQYDDVSEEASEDDDFDPLAGHTSEEEEEEIRYYDDV